jgi:predicted DNA-binding transcriptional regulator AlpA
MTKNHDLPELPNQAQERIIHSRELTKITGLSRTTIWRLIRANKFPQSFHLSAGRVGWKLTDILGWLNSLQQGA